MKKQIHTGTGDNISGDKHIHFYPQNVSRPNLDAASKIQVSRLPYTGNKLIGRDSEISRLNKIYKENNANVLTIKALGGTGKTTLISSWLDRLLAHPDTLKSTNIYTWSFYTHDISSKAQVSSDAFFADALKWFGYNGKPLVSSHNKGIKLAELINKTKSLLILDGVEPLQYPTGSNRGQLRDHGIRSLLVQLAASNKGICIITSRQDIVEINDKPNVNILCLKNLSLNNSVILMKSIGVHGSKKELANAAKEVFGHALSLKLLSYYLITVYNGNVVKREKITALSDELEEGDHAKHIMITYEHHIRDTPALEVLYIISLFFRPCTYASLLYLKNENIVGLSSSHQSELDWYNAFRILQKQELIYVDSVENSKTIHMHPLIREYFYNKLKNEKTDTYYEANDKLFNYYKNLPTKENPETIEEMEPLFSAIAHGCAASHHREAFINIYFVRIQRENTHYLTNNLNAHSLNIAILSYFFDELWDVPNPLLEKNEKTLLYYFASRSFIPLWRVDDAIRTLAHASRGFADENQLITSFSLISEINDLKLASGDINDILKEYKSSTINCPDISRAKNDHIKLATALHQSGDLDGAYKEFIEASELEKKINPDCPIVCSTYGFNYCDLLLDKRKWRKVKKRSKAWLQCGASSTLDHALYHLTLGRAYLQEAIESYLKENTPNNHAKIMPFEGYIFKNIRKLSTTGNTPITSIFNKSFSYTVYSLENLRKSGDEFYLVKGLLSIISLYRCYHSIFEDSDYASDLDITIKYLEEASDIAIHGKMILLYLDIRLEAARLAFTLDEDVLGKAAEEHIEFVLKNLKKVNYRRRTDECKYIKNIIHERQT